MACFLFLVPSFFFLYHFARPMDGAAGAWGSTQVQPHPGSADSIKRKHVNRPNSRPFLHVWRRLAVLTRNGICRFRAFSKNRNRGVCVCVCVPPVPQYVFRLTFSHSFSFESDHNSACAAVRSLDSAVSDSYEDRNPYGVSAIPKLQSPQQLVTDQFFATPTGPHPTTGGNSPIHPPDFEIITKQLPLTAIPCGPTAKQSCH